MAANPLSNVVFNAREELLTTDVNRAQKLLSAGVQNIFRDEGRGDDARSGSTFTVGAGTPNRGATKVPTLTFSAGFTSTVSEGQGFFDDGLATGLSDDTSDYPVLRWAATNVTFSAPDATNPRIDLVVVTPATVSTDNQTRNILLDPVARTVAQQSVPKKSNPVGTVSLVAGTPAASPVAPAVPGGTIAILEVLVPAAAPDASTFTPARRLPRQALFPVSTYHGIIQDCRLFWGIVNETTTSAVMTSFNGTSSINKVVINGEVLAFGPITTANGTVIQDAGGNNPFGAAAPANNDRPYYIYVAGGGNSSPQASIGAGNVLYPVVVVESLVAPLPDGRPSANLTTPRGTTQHAILIGVGWTVKNTTRRKACFMDGTWVRPLTGQNEIFGITTTPAFNEVVSRSTGAGITNHTLASAPSLNVTDAAEIMAAYENTVDNLVRGLGRNVGGTVFVKAFPHVDNFSGAGLPVLFTQELSGAGASVDATADPDNATAVLRLFSVGYRLNLRRYGQS